MVNLYCLNISLFENEFDNILPTLSSKRLEKISCLKQKNDKLRSMGAELILKYAIRDANLKCQFKILENEYGKPYIEGANNFHFSISHSGNYVVCATSDKPVGVDIEKISSINLKIADRYFSDDEIKYISDSYISYENKLNYTNITTPKFNENINDIPIKTKIEYEAFYEIWTHKESLVKAVGVGLSMPIKNINVLKSGEMSTTYFDKTLYHFKSYKIDNDYKLVVCSENENFSNAIIVDKIDFL